MRDLITCIERFDYMCDNNICRQFLPTVESYGGGAGLVILRGEAPFGLSNVVPAVGGRTPPPYLRLTLPDFACSNCCVLYIPSATIQHIKPKIA
jgi:hypothetical protein